MSQSDSQQPNPVDTSGSAPCSLDSNAEATLRATTKLAMIAEVKVSLFRVHRKRGLSVEGAIRLVEQEIVSDQHIEDLKTRPLLF